MKLLLRTICLLLLLASVPRLSWGQADTTRKAAALLHFIWPTGTSGERAIITLPNQNSFVLSPKSAVTYSLHSNGLIAVKIEAQLSSSSKSSDKPNYKRYFFRIKPGQTKDLIYDGYALKEATRSEGKKKLEKAQILDSKEESRINPILDTAFAVVHFLRPRDVATSNIFKLADIINSYQIDVNLPNQKAVNLPADGVLRYKIFSKGEVRIEIKIASTASQTIVLPEVQHGKDYFVKVAVLPASKLINEDEALLLFSKLPEEQLRTEDNRHPIDDEAPKRSGKGQSTCFLISPDGYLITNYHCIENSTEVKVKGINGDFNVTHAATVVAKDPSNDLALLKLTDPALKFPPLPYQLRTTGVMQAERIYALGFPVAEALGNEIKITEGIISSRSGPQGDVSKFQISAAVNPGNSGGPLIDENGNVIGVIHAKMGAVDATGYAVKALYLDTFLKSVDSFPYPTLTDRLAALKLPQKVAELEKCIFLLETK